MKLRRGSVARRSAAEWAVRGLLATVAAILGLSSVTQTLAYTLRNGARERAYALAPGDGRIVALVAQRLAGPEADTADRARADELARTALRLDATAVAAASTLGLNAQIRGDVATARRLFAYAGRLSRRELQTQLWAIEDAVGRGDVSGALRQYDIALRTSRTAPDLLFPVLMAAAADPAIRAALVGTLSARPAWSDAFLTYAAAKGSDPRVTARMFAAMRRAGVPVFKEADTAVINALVARNFRSDAWSYYATVRPGVDRRFSRDPDFRADLTAPSLFDWMPLNDDGVATSIQRGDRGGAFEFSAPASVGGRLLQQLQLLPPGGYRLDGRGTGVEGSSGAQVYWVLTCEDLREIGRVVLSDPMRADGRFAGRFDVPPDCPTQTLTLVAQPSNAVSGLSGRIDRARLVPVS